MDDPRAVMPLFLAPDDRRNFVEQAASGVLLSSAVAAVIGMTILIRVLPRPAPAAKPD